ncbi:DUF2065 domain-containing protein [Neptunicella marina]|uniref:DUF2065 domain-containing protein n=1 Tax=Neptunicella marina TaxID=2125989 RepID=A0A8J6IT43_9ALTE|nr:DUF2065 domain-containing protein [Neptunicella marina]
MFWLAFALFLILEGIGPLLFPKKWRRYILQIAEQPPQNLRTMGAVMVAIGVILWHVMK